GIGGEDARVLLTFQEEESVQEPEPVVDEAEVPRRPDALRERDEEPEEASAPAFAEELAAGAGVLKDLLALMGISAEVTPADRPRREQLDRARRSRPGPLPPADRWRVPWQSAKPLWTAAWLRTETGWIPPADGLRSATRSPLRGSSGEHRSRASVLSSDGRQL